MKMRTVIGAATAAVAIAAGPAMSANGVGERVTTNFEDQLPNVPGKSLVARVVDYAPGGASAPHAHPGSSFIYAYVVSGRIESKVNDGPTRVYSAGESWVEAPGSRHPVSRNASNTEPAKLLAVIVVDSADAKELVEPIR
jgi:quercetin dioxygenase-like cupin family protein